MYMETYRIEEQPYIKRGDGGFMSAALLRKGDRFQSPRTSEGVVTALYDYGDTSIADPRPDSIAVTDGTCSFFVACSYDDLVRVWRAS